MRRTSLERAQPDDTRRHRRLYAWIGVAVVIAPWILIWMLWRAWPWF